MKDMIRMRQIKNELFKLQMELNSCYGVGSSEVKKIKVICDRITKLRTELAELR